MKAPLQIGAVHQLVENAHDWHLELNKLCAWTFVQDICE